MNFPVFQPDVGVKDCTDLEQALTKAKNSLDSLERAIKAKKQQLDAAIQNHDPQKSELKQELAELKAMLPRAEEEVEVARSQLDECKKDLGELHL